MKKKLLIVLCCTALLMFSASSNAAQGMYFGGSLGMAMLSDSSLEIPGLNEEIEAVEQMIIEEYGYDDYQIDVGLKVKAKTGVAVSAALGYDFAGSLRLEGELAYQTNDIDKLAVSERDTATMDGVTDSYSFGADEDASGDFSSLALLANVYYDFKTKGAFSPFLTAGIGYAKVEINFSSEFLGAEDESEDDAVFAYQLGAGCGYALNETVTLDLRYRYFATQDPDFDGVKMEYSSNNIYLGIRYGF